MRRITEAAILTELGKPLSLLPLTIPELKPGQVLVDVAYSGLCHTQLLEIRGKRGPDPYVPHALGHEGSGIVAETAPDVKKVKPGDRVVISWMKGAGADVPSTAYISGDLKINSGAVGTFMRRTVTSENRVTPIPDALPLREAALLGCAIPTGAGVVLNTAKVKAGDSVAIFGIGGIGQSAVLAADFSEAGTIIAVDVVESKLELARRFGATRLIDARKEDPLKSIMEITGGRGVAFSFEAAGRGETMEVAFEAVRPGGGLCVLVGNLPFGERISIDPFELIRGKNIAGTWGGESRPDKDIPFYADLYLSGKLNLKDMITHVYALGEINRGFDELESGVVQRGLIDMERD